MYFDIRSTSERTESIKKIDIADLFPGFNDARGHRRYSIFVPRRFPSLARLFLLSRPLLKILLSLYFASVAFFHFVFITLNNHSSLVGNAHTKT